MPKTRQQKEKIVQDLVNKLKESKSLVLSNYHGMTVPEVQDLKKKLKEQDGDFSVVKNSLFKLALKEAGFEDAEDKVFDGPVAVSFSNDEEPHFEQFAESPRKSTSSWLNQASAPSFSNKVIIRSETS